MELIALLSNDEKEWAQVSGLMNHGDWEKIILVGDNKAKEFVHVKKFEFVKIDLTKKIIDLKETLMKKLKDKFDNMEVACSVASGNGKEHMALVSAIINLPMGIRFVALTKQGVTYL